MHERIRWQDMPETTFNERKAKRSRYMNSPEFGVIREQINARSNWICEYCHKESAVATMKLMTVFFMKN